MARQSKKEVITGFSNKYEISDEENFSGADSFVTSPSQSNMSKGKDKSLTKWIILTSVAIVAVILFTVLSQI